MVCLVAAVQTLVIVSEKREAARVLPAGQCVMVLDVGRRAGLGTGWERAGLSLTERSHRVRQRCCEFYFPTKEM